MSNYRKIDVELGQRSYPIHIGKSLLEKAPELLAESIADLSARRAFILYDKNVYPYVQVLEEALAGKVEQSKTYGIKGGEEAKSYNVLQQVLDWLLDQKIDRECVIFAVGGGVVGDLGGFAASIVLRGVPYVQVPTTLLSQVDSSVGGKTGINTAQGKNLIGSFYQPATVLADIGTLGTLPERELKAGYGEIVKYALINKPDFFEWLEKHADKLFALETEELLHAVETSCQAKADIVARDEKEKGQRALLNLGHTFAHSLEAACGYDGRLLHGEAVAIGIVLAFELSVSMGLCPPEELEKVQKHFQALGLKTSIADIVPPVKHTPEELYELMAADKKARGDKIGFILTRGIGSAFQSYDVDEAQLLHVLQKSLKGDV
ncbi:MAG: 3-dehydroquinate synthase [Alphaproteobacteria bacterium]|nr:3-dehydroquinate synthase [Alphaproteobacteria bacterium]